MKNPDDWLEPAASSLETLQETIISDSSFLIVCHTINVTEEHLFDLDGFCCFHKITYPEAMQGISIIISDFVRTAARDSGMSQAEIYHDLEKIIRYRKSISSNIN